VNLTIGQARGLAMRLLQAAGLQAENASVSAEAIVLADVWGVGSHGLMRLPFYLERMLAGGYPPNAQLVTVSDTGPVVSLDGGGGLGHWQLSRGAEIAAERCDEFGIAAVGVGNSGHCGALGVYTLAALRAGYLALVFSNGPAVMPPWGGSQPLLSTSPLAAGIPSRPQPAIIDLASSTVARGKIAEYAKRGQLLPEGWALDRKGRPTIEPTVALKGMLAPLGGAKGFALALLVEAMSGALVGPALSSDVTDMFAPEDATKPQRIGHLVITLNPAKFDVQGGKEAQARLDELARRVEAAGGRLPGARRMLPEDLDLEAALPITRQLEDQLAEWATRLGVPIGNGNARVNPHDA
jgi:(2R)-3-sulfolactate dehydrogenase (NADP+)